MNKYARLIKICTVIVATLLCVFIALLNVGSTYATVVNQALGIKPGDLQRSEGGDEDADTNYFPAEFTSATELSAYCDEVSKEVEGEGLVLLRNDSIGSSKALPLPANAQLSCFLTTSVKPNYSASGSVAVASSGFSDYKSALMANQFGFNSALADFYTDKLKGDYGRDKISGIYRVREVPWADYPLPVKNTFSLYGDAAIVIFARDAGEGTVDLSVKNSDTPSGNYLALSAQETQVLKELTLLRTSGTFKRIIVLLNSSAHMELDFMFQSDIKVDACMWIGNLGRVGALAVSDALAGKIVPSGKASDTFCRTNLTSPAMASWALNDNGTFGQMYSNWDSGINAGANILDDTQKYYGVYVEGIYVGYRYYETRYEDYVLGAAKVGEYDYTADVAYSFGYGLSYADFAYSNFSVKDNADDTYTVSVTVTNTSSSYDGKEAVQVYVQKPYASDGVEKASIELVGFKKTDLLAKGGGHETVTIDVDKESFKSYDNKTNGTYILSAGSYYLSVGNGAHDALNNILAKKGHTQATTESKMTSDGNANLANVAWFNPALDKVKYAKSVETKVTISNQLDFCDINRYINKGSGNAVAYVSRADWSGTFPTAKITLRVSGVAMRNDLMSKKEIVEDGSVSPQYGEKNDMTLAKLRGLEYNDAKWELLLNQMTYEEQARMLTAAGMGTAPIKSIAKPATVDDDGPTTIVHNSATKASYPCEGIWASSFNTDLINKIGKMFAEDGRMAGNNSLYAPGLNMHRTPYGGRSHEYFSEDPFLSAMSCVAQIKGMQSKGVIPTLKHYAFNDEESFRNGIGIWLNEQAAREIYLLPFEYAIRPSKGNAHGIMTSFNRAGCIWVSASSELMINISRREWGFDGYSITDMVVANGIKYMTHVDGFMNGTEVYLDTTGGSSLKEYNTSPAFQNKLREASHRFLYTVCNHSAAMNGLQGDSKIITLKPWWEIMLISFVSVFGALTAAGVGLWVFLLIEQKREG